MSENTEGCAGPLRSLSGNNEEGMSYGSGTDFGRDYIRGDVSFDCQ